MSLDIEKLKLTTEEMNSECLDCSKGELCHKIPDAATAKALYGIANWLEYYSETLDVFERNGVDGAAGALRRLAQEAGLKEP